MRWRLVPCPQTSPARGTRCSSTSSRSTQCGGVAPGIYRWVPGGLEQIEPGTFRREAAHLCLDQPLGGDCAFDAFHCAAIGDVIERSGARGYRSALLEAGTAMGRLQLAAYTLGHGASGITFYDDEVSAFLANGSVPDADHHRGRTQLPPPSGQAPRRDGAATSPAHLSRTSGATVLPGT